MKRDSFGICLTKAMLFKNLQSTFTHVRAYEKDATSPLDLKVLLAFPKCPEEICFKQCKVRVT